MGILYGSQGWASAPEEERGGTLVGHERRKLWSERVAAGRSEPEGLWRQRDFREPDGTRQLKPTLQRAKADPEQDHQWALL